MPFPAKHPAQPARPDLIEAQPQGASAGRSALTSPAYDTKGEISQMAEALCCQAGWGCTTVDQLRGWVPVPSLAPPTRSQLPTWRISSPTPAALL